MLEITAICKTKGCAFEKKESVFVSNVTATVCAACGNEITDITTKEVTDGTAEISE